MQRDLIVELIQKEITMNEQYLVDSSIERQLEKDRQLIKEAEVRIKRNVGILNEANAKLVFYKAWLKTYLETQNKP